jgi:hypothetical protein
MSPETDKTKMHDQQKMAVRVTYKSGIVYEGQMSNWVPNGEGRLFLCDGVTYKVILYVDYYCSPSIETFRQTHF